MYEVAMHVSNPFTASNTVASPDGTLLLSETDTEIVVRKTRCAYNGDLPIIRRIALSQPSTRSPRLSWAPIPHNAEHSNRFLVAEEKTVKVYDLSDEAWSAQIEYKPGTDGTIAKAEFGGDDAEVLITPSQSGPLTVCSLWYGTQVEIKNPKCYTNGTGRNHNFALLSRQGASDVVTIHSPKSSYKVLTTFKPATTDAQGIKWSPDGRWLAIWDIGALGYKVLIYTADGNLFRRYVNDNFADDFQNLGVKTVEWTPDSRFLAVGAHDTTVRLLDTARMTPAIQLAHPATVSPFKTQVHVQRSGGNWEAPSGAYHLDSSDTGSGVSILAFNADGSLLATKHERYPGAIWIWDLASTRSVAVLAQTENMRSVAWHPRDPDLLLIQTSTGSSEISLWNARENNNAPPQKINSHKGERIAGERTCWLRDGKNEHPALLVQNSKHGNAVVRALGASSSPSMNGSLPEVDNETRSLHDGFTALDDSIQDTFDFRRGVKAH